MKQPTSRALDSPALHPPITAQHCVERCRPRTAAPRTMPSLTKNMAPPRRHSCSPMTCRAPGARASSTLNPRSRHPLAEAMARAMAASLRVSTNPRCAMQDASSPTSSSRASPNRNRSASHCSSSRLQRMGRSSMLSSANRRCRKPSSTQSTYLWAWGCSLCLWP
jgi:hypothetical protein